MADTFNPYNTNPDYGALDLFAERGRQGSRIFSGYIFDEFVPSLSSWPLRVKVYREMLTNDPIISAMFQTVEILCKQANFDILPGSDSPEDEKLAAFVKEVLFDDLNQPFKETLAEWLTFIAWGWSFSELRFKKRNGRQDNPIDSSQFSDGKVGIGRFAPRGQDTLLHWNFDPTGTVTGITQLSPPDYRTTDIPIYGPGGLSKSLHFHTSTNNGSPEGSAILRKIYRCFSADTDLLTENGWKRAGEVTELDRVGTLDPNTNRLLFELPSKVWAYEHEGEMVWVHGKFIDQLVTPNHRMWIRRDHKEQFEFIEAQDCSVSVSFKTDCDWNVPDTQIITVGSKEVSGDLWAEFMGYWLSEGHTWSNGTRHEVGLTPAGRKEIWQRLSPLGLQPARRIPREILAMSRRQIRIFLNAYLAGDGTMNGPTPLLFTSSEAMADDLTEAGFKAGYRAKKYWHNNPQSFSSIKGIWNVSLGRHTKRTLCKWEMVAYAGKVYCVTTSSGVVITRRNGKTSWSGNSWYMCQREENLEGIGIERDSAGLPCIKIPAVYMLPGATDEQKATFELFKTIAANLRVDEQAGLVIPSDMFPDSKTPMFEVSLLSTAGQKQFDVGATISRWNRIKLTILMADFLLMGHEKVGSFALADQKTELFADACGGYLDHICDQVNRHAIPTLLQLNGETPDKMPKLTHGDIESVDPKELTESILNLANANVNLEPIIKPALNRMGYEIPDDVKLINEPKPVVSLPGFGQPEKVNENGKAKTNGKKSPAKELVASNGKVKK